MLTDMASARHRFLGESWSMVIMPPHTTRLLVLTHSDAVSPIPSAVQQCGRVGSAPRAWGKHLSTFGPRIHVRLAVREVYHRLQQQINW